MKNPHGVEPTRYMKRKESREAIKCNPRCGPVFGNGGIDGTFLYIDYQRDQERVSSFEHGVENAYEYHPQYQSSLFVNDAGPDEVNYFIILDYEVYTVENYKDYIRNVCKYSDVIWKYVQTKDIDEKHLKEINDEDGLLEDLSNIHDDNKNIRIKIINYPIRDEFMYLPNSRIVDTTYDNYLKEWLGDSIKWKLIYRASVFEYTGKSFHECCNDKGPTLIVIKSSEGWIFGGYTTQSWRGWSIYNEMI